MSLSTSFSDLALKEDNGSYYLAGKHLHEGETSHDVAPFPLDLVLGNINGDLRWGNKDFSKSASKVRLEGTVIVASLKTESGGENEARFDLNDKFVVDEKEGGEPGFKAIDVPALVYLPSAVVIPQFNVSASTGEGDDAKVGYATAGASNTNTSLVDGVINHSSVEANASASLFHVEQTKGGPMSQCQVDILSVGAEARAEHIDVGGVVIPKYAGVDASVNLVKMDAGPFSLNVGAGANTDFGIKGTSAEVHVAGCGVTIGTTIGISAFGSGFSIDFTKLFSW